MNFKRVNKAEKLRMTDRPCRHCGDKRRYIHGNRCPTCMTMAYEKKKAQNIEGLRNRWRRGHALRNGYVPPPDEADCPPRPKDDRCQLCCHTSQYLALDHCHASGAFRGWLCLSCNQMFGKIERIGFEKIAKYLSEGGISRVETRDWIYVSTGFRGRDLDFSLKT